VRHVLLDENPGGPKEFCRECIDRHDVLRGVGRLFVTRLCRYLLCSCKFKGAWELKQFWSENLKGKIQLWKQGSK
jgi:hypothetical protein